MNQHRQKSIRIITKCCAIIERLHKVFTLLELWESLERHVGEKAGWMRIKSNPSDLSKRNDMLTGEKMIKKGHRKNKIIFNLHRTPKFKI